LLEGDQRGDGTREVDPAPASLELASLVGAAVARSLPGSPVRPAGRRPSSWPERFPTKQVQGAKRKRLHDFAK